MIFWGFFATKDDSPVLLGSILFVFSRTLVKVFFNSIKRFGSFAGEEKTNNTKDDGVQG